jgi:hypothetical protein
MRYEVKIGSTNPRWDDTETTTHDTLDDAQDHVVTVLDREAGERTEEPEFASDVAERKLELQRLVELPWHTQIGDPTYEPIFVEINEVEREPQPSEPQIEDLADKAYEMAGDR